MLWCWFSARWVHCGMIDYLVIVYIICCTCNYSCVVYCHSCSKAKDPNTPPSAVWKAKQERINPQNAKLSIYVPRLEPERSPDSDLLNSMPHAPLTPHILLWNFRHIISYPYTYMHVFLILTCTTAIFFWIWHNSDNIWFQGAISQCITISSGWETFSSPDGIGLFMSSAGCGKWSMFTLCNILPLYC